MQFHGAASRVVYCKAWILGCCALQLVAFTPSAATPAVTEGTQAIVRNLLEPSDDRGSLMNAAVPGEPRLRGTLVACLSSLASIGSVDLGRCWRDQKVRLRSPASFVLDSPLSKSCRLHGPQANVHAWPRYWCTRVRMHAQVCCGPVGPC